MSIRTIPDNVQGLGGGLIALPSFAKRFGLDKYDPKSKELADLKGNIVSILQGGRLVQCSLECSIITTWE